MTIDGELEAIEEKVKQDTGEPYVRVRMKGRVFITFDAALMHELLELHNRYVRLGYSFFKSNKEPNVYRLDSVSVE